MERELVIKNFINNNDLHNFFRIFFFARLLLNLFFSLVVPSRDDAKHQHFFERSSLRVEGGFEVDEAPFKGETRQQKNSLIDKNC